MRLARLIVWIGFQGVILLALVLAGVGVVARFSDGPIIVFPGGPLTSGIPTEYGAVDWSRLAHIREIEFQLITPPRSRTTRVWIHDDAPYVPCSFCTNRVLKRWPRELERDDRVVIRIDGMLIEGRARRVANDSAEFEAAKHTRALRHSQQSDFRSAAEDRAADLVVGVARQAPGTQGASETDWWLYRIDPR